MLLFVSVVKNLALYLSYFATDVDLIMDIKINFKFRALSFHDEKFT
jgi:hypothetical protein